MCDSPCTVLAPPLLTKAAREDVVRTTLGMYNKRLDPTQLDLLVSNEGSQNPFWLSLACQELRVFGVFETVTARIKELESTVDGLLGQVLKRVVEEDSSGLVRQALVFLACGLGGLSEPELLDLLGTPNCKGADRVITPLPMAEWSPIMLRARPFILNSGSGSLALLNSVITSKILDTFGAEHAQGREGLEIETYTRMTDYFEFHSSEGCRNNKFPQFLYYTRDHPRIISFLRDKTRPPVSDSIFRKLLHSVRCKTIFNTMRVGNSAFPVPERMCMGCGIKATFSNGRIANSCACFLCGRILFTQNMRPSTGFPPGFAPKMGEKLVYRCRQHSDYTHIPNAAAVKCLVCKCLLGTSAQCFPVMTCISCAMTGMAGLGCCELV